jgi:hypothetical protein
MGTKLFTAFLCVCCWLHGATVGVAVGDALDLQHFFLISLSVFFTITVIYPTSRRLAASALLLACAAFLSSLVKSLAFFRTPNHHSALPDVGHDFLPNIPIPPTVLLQLVLGATCVFVSLHPRRVVIMRRVLLIYATLLMARTLLALMTFLPDSNPNCFVEDEKSPSAKEIVQHFLLHRKTLPQWIKLQMTTISTTMSTSTDDLTTRMIMNTQTADVDAHKHASSSPNMTAASTYYCRDTIYCGHATLLVLCGMIWHTYFPRVESPINFVKSVVWLTVILAMVHASHHLLPPSSSSSSSSIYWKSSLNVPTRILCIYHFQADPYRSDDCSNLMMIKIGHRS